MRFSYSSGSKPLAGYTIKRGIGIGGFGEVYFALNDAGKEVALKKIQRNLDVELRGVRHCLNLKHVNLISLWDIQTNDYGESWVVMEYVPGPSLRDVVEDNPQGMPEPLVKQWFASIAAGVAHLHEHGIVHRDLKPGNIFHDRDEQVVKIGDYGLSKFISHSRRSGQTESVGTFHYMAPEIGKGEYGKEIDIYAMGIILFEMLTGDVPFNGESNQEIIMKHLTMTPDLGGVPEAYRKVLERALRKDPARRYGTVAEMLADLPWPELLSADGNRLLAPHAVGLLRLDAGVREGDPSTNDHPGSVASRASLASNDPRHKLPPALLDTRGLAADEEIRFGPLTDSSAGKPTAALHVIDDPGDASSPTPLATPAETLRPARREPIASAVGSVWSRAAGWWDQANVSTPVKIGLLVVLAIVIVQNSRWLLPMVLGLVGGYTAYYVGRRIWLARQPQSAPPSPRQQRRLLDARLRRWLAELPAQDRMTDLVGAMLLAAVAAIVLNLLALAVGGGIRQNSVETWAVFTWQALVSVAAVWTVLLMTQRWALPSSEAWVKWVVSAAAGLGMGLVAFYSAGSFEIDLARVTQEDVLAREATQLVWQGLPKLPAFLIFFTVWFLVMPWTSHTDPFRRTRLSLLLVLAGLALATLLGHLLHVPLTSLGILVVVVSIAVQLASPWLHPKRRLEIAASLPPTPEANFPAID